MSEKTKLIVFAKKEILLLLVFFFLAVGISFTLGFRMGKDYSFLTTHDPSDRQLVERTAQMKSTEEEVVERQQQEEVEQQTKLAEPSEFTGDTNKMMEKHLQQKLREEDSYVDSNPAGTVSADESIEKANKEELAGKFTIQLGSFLSFSEAEEFAQGFKMRGYSPIVEKSEIPNKGTRFSVSLGSFDNQNEAKDYIAKERSLFISQDYFIREIR